MISRGHVRRITDRGIFVEVPDFAKGHLLGPCQTTSNVFRLGQQVIVTQMGRFSNEYAILGPTLGGLQVDDGIPSFENPAERDKYIKNPNRKILIWVESVSQLQYWDGAAWVSAVDKEDVGLGKVANTTDLEKPVSLAQQAALDLKKNMYASELGLVNLNTILVPGDYYQSVSGNATAANNYPVNMAGLLFVHRRTGGNTIGQIFMPYTASNDKINGAIYTRTINVASNVISTWKNAGAPNTSILTDTANLNDIVQEGSYYQSQTANATFARNYPVQQAGQLEIRHSTVQGTDYMVYQTYTGFRGQGTFTRQRYNGVWTGWVMVGGYDTGWAILPDTTHWEGSALVARRVGDTVTLRGSFRLKSGGTMAGTTITSLPSGMQPSGNTRLGPFINAAGVVLASVMLGTDGNLLTEAAYITGSQTSGSFFPANTSYLV